MKKFKNDINQIKPWFLLTTYGIGLIFILNNFHFIFDRFNKYLSLLNPLINAVAIAFVLNIPMTIIEIQIKKYTEKNSILKRYTRALSIILTLILALLIIAFLVSIILPQLITTISSLIANLVPFLNSIVDNIDSILKFFKLDGLDIEFNSTSINNFFNSLGLDLNKIISNATNILGYTGQSIFSYISTFTIGFGNAFLSFMLSLYLLSGKETFITQFNKIIYATLNEKLADKVMVFYVKVNKVFYNFISGQLLEAIIIGVLIYFALLITKMPYAMLIACLTSVMSLVPVLGATLACCIGFILVLSHDPIKAIWFVIIYQTVQQFENNYIYPKVVGNSVGLPGIWTLLSIIVFGGVYGVVGMILAVPLTALIYTTLGEFINKKLKNKNLEVTHNKVSNTTN